MATRVARQLSADEWRAEGARLFGDDMMDWRFRCPSCGHVASVRDWKLAGAPEGAVAYSCVGRWLPDPVEAFSNANIDTEPGGPCNYAGGGLIGINPVKVLDGNKEHDVFEFATK